jgi:hypothetical protein
MSTTAWSARWGKESSISSGARVALVRMEPEEPAASLFTGFVTFLHISQPS